MAAPVTFFSPVLVPTPPATIPSAKLSRYAYGLIALLLAADAPLSVGYPFLSYAIRAPIDKPPDRRVDPEALTCRLPTILGFSQFGVTVRFFFFLCPRRHRFLAIDFLTCESLQFAGASPAHCLSRLPRSSASGALEHADHSLRLWHKKIPRTSTIFPRATQCPCLPVLSAARPPASSLDFMTAAIFS